MKSFPPTAVAQFRAASFAMRTFGLLEFDELFPLAASVLLLAYIEGRFRSVLAKVHVPDIKIVVCGLVVALYRSRGRKMVHGLHGVLSITRHRSPDRRRPRAGPRCSAGDGLAEKTDSANWTRRMDRLLGDSKLD
jgi:SulP family sulfate permease